MARLPSELLLHTFELATAIPNLPLTSALSSFTSPSSCPSSSLSSHAPSSSSSSLYSPHSPFALPNSSFPPFVVSPDSYGGPEDLLTSIRTSRALVSVCRRWYGLAVSGLYRALPIYVDAKKDGDVDLSRLVQLRDTLVRSAQQHHDEGGEDRPGIGNGTPDKHLGHHTRYLLFASLPPYESCKPHIPTIKQLSCDIIALLPNLAVFSYRSRSTILTNMIPVLLDTAGRAHEDGKGGQREGSLRMVHSVCAASWRDVEGGVGWALGRDEEGGDDGDDGCEGMRAWLVGATTGTRNFCAVSSPPGPGDGGGRTRLCPSEMLKWRRLTFARVVLSSACDYCCHLHPTSSESGSNPPETSSSASTWTSSYELHPDPQPNPNLTQIFLLATHLSRVTNFPVASDHSLYANNFQASHDPDPIDTTLLCVTSPCTRRFLQVQGRYLKTVYIDVDYFGKEALQELLYLLTRCSGGNVDGATGSGTSSGTSSPTSSSSPSGSVTDSGYYSGSIYDSGDGAEEGRRGLNVVLLLDRWDQFPSDLHIPVGIKALGVHVRTPWRSHPWHVSKGLKSASITPYFDSLHAECEQDGEGVEGGGGSEIARTDGRRVRGGLEVIRFFNEERVPGVKAVCARAFGKGLKVEDVDDWGG